MILDFSSSQPTLLQGIQNLASSVVSQAIVRPLGSPNLLGVSGFMFDILDDEEITCDADITDHVVEANFSIQDHIALRPVRFTLRAYAAEQTDNIQQAIENLFLNAVGLQSLNGLLPSYNPQDAQFYSGIATIAQQSINAVNSVSSIAQLFGLISTTATKQQSAFQYFFQMQQTRQLCQVETPFAVFDSMAIERIVALQSGSNRYIGDFTITFKQIKTVQSISISNPIASVTSSNTGTIANINPLSSGRAYDMQQADSPFNLGTLSGSEDSFSTLANSFSGQSTT